MNKVNAQEWHHDRSDTDDEHSSDSDIGVDKQKKKKVLEVSLSDDE